MDRLEIGSKITALFSKYKYTLLIVLLGFLLMLLPERAEISEPHEITVPQAESKSQEEKLEDILSQISGVGKVKVLLTEAVGTETVYQTNEDRNVSDGTQHVQIETVIISDGSREEHGLIRTVTPPIYLGAIIVCQGGDRPTVKLSVVEAVSSVTGISSERICVLKMK